MSDYSPIKAVLKWTRDARLRHPCCECLRDDEPARKVVRQEPSR